MTTRIAPVEPPYAPAVAAMLAKWMPPGASVAPLVLFRTLARHEELFSRMRPTGAGILGSRIIAPDVREVMILRTSARAGAEYEWGVHAASFAATVGLTDAQLDATAHGGADDPCWTPEQCAVLRMADELHDSGAISDELHAELAAHFDARQILELAVTAGWYHVIAYVIGVAGIEPESWARPYPRNP